jgi:hypothetical protein
MRHFEAWYGLFVVRHRWWILLVSLLAAVGSAAGMGRLQFVNNSRMYFSRENPQLQALEMLENTYTKYENVLFVVEPAGGDIFERRTLSAIEELTAQAWTLPYSSKVSSLTNFQHTRAEGDELVVEDLVRDAASLSDGELAAIRAIALNEPLLVNSLVSPTAHVTGVNVNIIKPEKAIDESQQVAEQARALARRIEAAHPGITLHLTGGIMVDSAFGEAPKRDMVGLMPVVLLLFFVMMIAALRSLTATLATFAVVFMAVFTGMGLAGWLGIAVTPASANGPIIILTLAVADSIHILVTMFQQMRLGRSRREAVAESLRINLQPVFVTSLTTAIGFLTMNFSDAPPFRDLGNIVAMGVTAAFFYSVLFLPALAALVPMRVGDQQGRQAALFEGLGRFVVARRTPLFWWLLLFMAVMTTGISRIELDDDFVRYFDHSYDFRRASEFAIANLTGVYIVDYSLDAGEEGGINNPAYLATVDAFAGWLRRQDKVRHVFTITDIMKRLNRSMHGDDQGWYRLPDQRELAAQYLLLYEMSLPFGLDLNDRINLDKSATRLTVILGDSTTREVRELEEKGRGWLVDNAPPAMHTYGSGLSVIFSHISIRNIHAMLGASLLALFVISLILALLLRSVKLGLISLLPNLSPAFMAFGLWGYTVGQVGLAVSVMMAMTMGIVVDDTVHFLSKYRRARREHGAGAEEAVLYAFRTVGSPILATTLILVAGFTVLAFSGFQINANMGAMTAITIVFALIMDFFFLPSLLIKLEGGAVPLTPNQEVS